MSDNNGNGKDHGHDQDNDGVDEVDDDVGSDFVRVSFSSRGSRSLTIERSQSSRRRSAAFPSGEWRPPRPAKQRRYLLRKLNAAVYNFMAKLRQLFGPCCRLIVASRRDAPIVLLGLRYAESESRFELLADVDSRLYFSYRTGFAPLQHSRVEISSDTGWGCTIRTAQMLIAEGLIRHLLGRDYRRAYATRAETRTIEAIQRLFHDEPSDECPLSIHHLTAMAFREFGKKPGQWYNPSMVGHVLYKSVNQRHHDHHQHQHHHQQQQQQQQDRQEQHQRQEQDRQKQQQQEQEERRRRRRRRQRQQRRETLGDPAAPELNDVCVYVARDGCVFVHDLLELCTPKNDDAKWRAPLVLVPLRLGIDSVRPAYCECLRRVLENRYSIGFVGGRDSSSYFFVGYQDDELLYLDPHYLQNSGDRAADHYLAKELRRMRFRSLQPSCLLGFYCRDQDELGDFLKSLEDDVSAIENESGAAFRLVDICVGSADSLQSSTLLSRKSIDSLEVLSLFEPRDKTLKQLDS